MAQVEFRVAPTAAMVQFASVLGFTGGDFDEHVASELDENPALYQRSRPRNTTTGLEQAIDHPALCDWRHDLLHAARAEAPIPLHGACAVVVEALDDRGFLQTDPTQLAFLARCGMLELETALETIRSVGPVGIATSGPVDCLLRQLDALSERQTVPAAARRLLAELLENVAAGQRAVCRQALGITDAELDDALAFIRTRLRPYPLEDGHGDQALGSPPAPAPVDLIVLERAGRFHAVATERQRHDLAIDPAIRSVVDQTDSPVNALQHAVDRAVRFLSQIEQRWHTLERVATEVITYQRPFLDNGPLRPLTRAEIASRLRLSESTVSRATSHRSIRLPDSRTIPLDTFFPRQGNLETELRRIIDEEEIPLSDEGLAERLRQNGYDVARRTICKYRMRLGIASATSRHPHTEKPTLE